MSNNLIPLRLTTLAGNASIDFPKEWEDKTSVTHELSFRPSFASRYFEAAKKLKVLRPLLDDASALLLLPSILSLPFVNKEEEESIKAEAEIIRSYWCGK